MTIFNKLGLKYPIIQGAMANISTHVLAAAVSNAGGLGVIAAGGWDADKLREEIRLCKKATTKPFAVNIMLMSPFVEDIAKMVIEERVKVITTGAGNPGKFMKAWMDAGITVIPVVPSVALAKRICRLGVDAIIVEGTEAGGHIGETSTMSLVPQVVDAVDCEVIAAGGIADARGVVAAFALGAVGVQAGTVFLASEECPIHVNYKNAVVKARDTSTIVTGRFTGAPVRVIKNKMAKEYIKIANEGIELEKLEELTLGSLRKAVLDGDTERGSLMAGQIAGMVSAIRPVKEILSSMFEVGSILNKLGEINE